VYLSISPFLHDAILEGGDIWPRRRRTTEETGGEEEEGGKAEGTYHFFN
jgi:hypothetical protein